MAIPLILHVTSRAVPLRGFERRLAAANATVLRGWERRVWSDEDNTALVRDRYPQLSRSFDGLPFGVLRADVVRLLYLHSFGGWYSDSDYEWRVDPTAEFGSEAAVLPFSRDGDSGESAKIGNAVLGSEAGHPVWLKLAEGILAQPANAVSLSTVECFSGPEYLTSMRPMIESFTDIAMPPRRRFHPQLTASSRADPDTVGLHHARASWRVRHLRGDVAWRLRSWPAW